MVEVEVRVAKIQCEKLLGMAEVGSEIAFDVNASLSETSRNPGLLTLDFDLAFETQPMVAKFFLAGSAMIRGKDEEIQDLITLENQDSAPDVFMKIYEKVYAILYLLSGTIAIPYPTPGLIKKTQIYSTKGAIQPFVIAR
ncbi:MAG: hypothetical protein HYU02_08065 [Thaumarchaeota archaeon]|nr:hypothetical protein [Nitrososphaerota archaeon]